MGVAFFIESLIVLSILWSYTTASILASFLPPIWIACDTYCITYEKRFFENNNLYWYFSLECFYLCEGCLTDWEILA